MRGRVTEPSDCLKPPAEAWDELELQCPSIVPGCSLPSMSGALHAAPSCLRFLLLFLLLASCSAFNLDVTETVLKYGDNGSFFGFSVALHQQLRPLPVSW